MLIRLLQTAQAEQTSWKNDLLEEGKVYHHRLILGQTAFSPDREALSAAQRPNFSAAILQQDMAICDTFLVVSLVLPFGAAATFEMVQDETQVTNHLNCTESKSSGNLSTFCFQTTTFPVSISSPWQMAELGEKTLLQIMLYSLTLSGSSLLHVSTLPSVIAIFWGKRNLYILRRAIPAFPMVLTHLLGPWEFSPMLLFPKHFLLSSPQCSCFIKDQETEKAKRRQVSHPCAIKNVASENKFLEHKRKRETLISGWEMKKVVPINN